MLLCNLVVSRFLCFRCRAWERASSINARTRYELNVTACGCIVLLLPEERISLRMFSRIGKGAASGASSEASDIGKSKRASNRVDRAPC